MMTGKFPDHPPEIREFFKDWRAASDFFVFALVRAKNDGYLIRAAELRHDVDFDTKEDRIMVYIRRFPEG
jgi:hypothetical protein